MKNLIINEKIFKPYDSTYYVSEDGEIYSTYAKKILKPNTDIDGYLRLDIHGKHMKVHQLVYECWIGKLDVEKQINHRDDDKLNNHYRNLYAGTQKQNLQDCKDNGHRVGNVFYLTIEDKKENKIITFCPASDFIGYSGHPCANGSLKRMFTRNWFKGRFLIIEYKKINNLNELKGVTTMGDECSPVGREMSPLEAHRTGNSEEIV